MKFRYHVIFGFAIPVMFSQLFVWIEKWNKWKIYQFIIDSCKSSWNRSQNLRCTKELSSSVYCKLVCDFSVLVMPTSLIYSKLQRVGNQSLGLWCFTSDDAMWIKDSYWLKQSLRQREFYFIWSLASKSMRLVTNCMNMAVRTLPQLDLPISLYLAP